MSTLTATAVREAAEVLGIADRASLNEIRQRYHELLKEWHPDVSRNGTAESHERTVRLNEAYRLLEYYCRNYEFSFRLDEVRQQLEFSSADYWMERFGDDPIWG